MAQGFASFLADATEQTQLDDSEKYGAQADGGTSILALVERKAASSQRRREFQEKTAAIKKYQTSQLAKKKAGTLKASSMEELKMK